MRAISIAFFILLFPYVAGATVRSPYIEGMNGIASGEDTSFQIGDSDYLNISVQSTEVIKLRVESVPKVISMRLKPVSASATSTQLTITGLEPSTLYYKYEDTLRNLVATSSDENGSYSYEQDISKPHIVFIQPRKSTKFIQNDATGGDCASMGTWDAATLTCTLTADIAETIEIDSDGVTLDGGGHTQDGSPDLVDGVYLNERTDVTIKNLHIKNFSYGVNINSSSNTHIEDNTFLDNGSEAIVAFTSNANTILGNVVSFLAPSQVRAQGFAFFDSANDLLERNSISMRHDDDQEVLFFNSHNIIITNNTFSNSKDSLLLFDSYENTITNNIFSNSENLLFLYNTYDNTITNNTFSNSKDSLFLYDSYGNTITSNTLSGADRALFLFSSHDNTIANNTFSSSTEALFVYESSYGNTIYNNNFINNKTNAADHSDMANTFSLSKPNGGNYFESSEECSDADFDGFCDAPYDFFGGQDTLPWTMQNGWGDAPIVHTSNYSNVLFLPGIEGSRLYEGIGCGKKAEEKLWEPVDSVWSIVRGAGDSKVESLALDSNGESVCSDIYTKTGDVIDATMGGNLYKSFLDEMNGLKIDGTIKDWKPVAYDWRLSLDELLNYGAERDGKIYYEEATSTPYIEQTLRALAKNSKTGKVTIVAHSNGGLVTKALLNQLGGEASKLVDKIIMVGAPQSGAPADVGSLLVGYGAGLYSDVGPFQKALTIVSNQAARTFSQNSPMAYHLLPSQSYFTSIIDEPAHPVVHFSGDGYAKERAAYGNSIVDASTLDDFLLAKNGEREKPAENNLGEAEILNSGLIEYANYQHDALDVWTPPSGIEVSQIAGWGVDTVAGVDFYTQDATDVVSALEPTRLYRPITVEDGDGTVPVPSALMMASSTNVKRYWVDLSSIYKDTKVKRSHGDLFEIPSLQYFIKNIITNSTSTFPTYISATQLAPIVGNKKLTFYLHSPLTLEITDSSGKVTGLSSVDSVTQDIPGSTYGEFGEVKYVTVPEGSEYHLTLHGQSSGTFSLDIQESSGGVVTALSTIANVPTTASTLASLTITNGIDTASALTVDENGDGKNVVTIIPKIGETVNYEPPAPTPAPQTRSTGSGARHISIPSIIPILVATTTSTSSPQATEVAPATTTQPVVNTSVVVATKPLQEKKKASVPIVPSEKVNTNVSQTASVYEASQQSVLRKLGAIVYNGLQGFWNALKKFF